MASSAGGNEDGVSVRDMRLKVLYTFDDQNKTNCLARWPHVLRIQTVAMDETTSIGVVELKTCIDAIVECSPELVARIGQDYTVYAYDYSEYDHPLVGHGMLSRALSTASPTTSQASASQPRQLITGRVCKNIMGIFSNGVKETLEVKLRLVPVPTRLQDEYHNTMHRYRDMSKILPPGFDPNEWNSFLQSNPNLGQTARKFSPTPVMNPSSNGRDGMSMEVMNQLLSPHLQPPGMPNPFNQHQHQQFEQHTHHYHQLQLSQQPQFGQNSHNQGPQLGQHPQSNQQPRFDQNGTHPAKHSGVAPNHEEPCGNDQNKKTSRPSSRASMKRPRARKPKTSAAVGGNTSGYEEGTDGDDGPASKKRAKVTKAIWDGNASLDTTPDSLRVAAGTSGSLRLFRPIAVNHQMQMGGSNNHLAETPRAPTPVPYMQNQQLPGPRPSSLRRESNASQQHSASSQHPSYRQSPEDQVRRSIESAHPSPERFSPVETPLDIASSPPVMRTRPPSDLCSSPPCPSSPVLPQMPRTDSGFMSGALDGLFEEDEETLRPVDHDDPEVVAREELDQQVAHHRAQYPPGGSDFTFVMQEEVPGPPELLPTRTPNIGSRSLVEGRAKAAMGLARGSVVSEDGQVLPPLKKNKRAPIRRAMSQPEIRQPQYQSQKSSLGPGPRDKRSALPELRPYPQSLSQPPPDLPPSAKEPLNGKPVPQPEYVTTMQYQGPPPPNYQSDVTNTAWNPNTAPLPPQVPQPDAFPQPKPNSQQTPAPEPAPPQASMTTLANVPASAPRSRPTSRSGMMVRTASMGSLSLPQIPVSDPAPLPPGSQRSQAFLEAPYSASETPLPFAEQQRMTPCMKDNVPPPRDKMPNPNKNPKASYSKKKLELAIANGEMPPYCANCGAVQTTTWRKAHYQDLDGEPGYHEYSDQPGCVTAIIILQRNEQSKPTKYRLVKKALGEGELPQNFEELLLCNPCGIWMSKYKTHRPENMWEPSGLMKPRDRQPAAKSVSKPARQRKPRAKKGQSGLPTSEANLPMSEFPVSDVNFPISEAQGPGNLDDASPGHAIDMQQPPPVNTEDLLSRRSTSAQPKRRLHAMTSDAAPDALRRAIQSSPARWMGTQQSPIDIEDEPVGLTPTRRLLFPSPRKDGSPKVLGDVAISVKQVATESRSPKHRMAEAEPKDKENSQPAVDNDDIDAELLHLFEEEMAKANEVERPSTPVQKTPTQNAFKTPTRPTPTHRPVTRSVSRSIRSARSMRSAKSPSQLLLFNRTPTRTPKSGAYRRSPRNHGADAESPFTRSLNQIMSEANNQVSPSRQHPDMGLDFSSLPDLPNLGQGHDGDMNFDFEDFFSTDVPMPSSPPGEFALYEDPVMPEVAAGGVSWSQFGRFGPDRDGDVNDQVVLIKDEPDMSPTKIPESRK